MSGGTAEEMALIPLEKNVQLSFNDIQVRGVNDIDSVDSDRGKGLVFTR